MALVGAALGLLLSIPAAGAAPGYIDSAACAACHAQIAESYSRTGMARSFYRVSPENTPPAATFYHAASDRHYQLQREGSRYLLRRWQEGDAGRRYNVVEKTIDYVLGSGNHARSYLSRAEDGRLIALPLAWYSEKGGFWTMAPGYDRPDHADLRREIGFDCMFCHNGYPEASPGLGAFGEPPRFQGRLPEGIDCQRCHGPGAAHVDAARRGARPDLVRSTIVNPRRLSHERQLEVCLQCHLESTSRRLPYALRRHGRGVFSYRPGEPLGEYMLHLDLAPDAERSKTFEVVHAGYQLLQSACYLGSGRMLTCTTCHDPHAPARGEAAVAKYQAACRQCHESPNHSSPVSGSCAGCHMPKRRTDDAVHVVMTEHIIRRNPPAEDLLAPKSEAHEPESHSFLGQVVPFYPKELPEKDELYLAVAQVRESANLADGIPRLKRALERFRPDDGRFYFELGEALLIQGDPRQAAPILEQAIRRSPGFAPAMRSLGSAYLASGQTDRAIAALEKAASLDGGTVETLNALGTAYERRSRLADAIATLRRAASANPDAPEPQLNLGVSLSRANQTDAAQAAFREAIRLRPDFAAAHNNLAMLLERSGDAVQAGLHFQQAVRHDPSYAEARHNFGLHLARRSDWAKAREQFAEAVRIAPSAAGHMNLGTALARTGNAVAAIEQYRLALRMDNSFEQARLNLARTLASVGENGEAIEQLRPLLASQTPGTAAAARELLKVIKRR